MNQEIDVKARFVKKGQDLHLVVPPSGTNDQSSRLDRALVKAIARAVTWYDDLSSGFRYFNARDRPAGASQRALHRAGALLKPNLVEGCVVGTLGMSIAAAGLAKGVTFPAVWEAKETQLSGDKPV